MSFEAQYDIKKCFEGFSSSVMRRFIPGLVVPLSFERLYCLYIQGKKKPFQTEAKNKKSFQNSATLLPTARTLTFRKTYCYFCSSSTSFSSCHFLWFIDTFYYVSTFCTFVICYSLSFSLASSLLDSYPSLWLKR